MKRIRSAVFAPILLALALFSFPAFADDIQEQLKSDYVGKKLMLRHFYDSKHLVFESDGSLVGSAEVGPWTVDGKILVKSIDVNERTLQIHARRVCMVFIREASSFMDVLDFLKNGKPEDTKEAKKFYETNDVDIDIRLTSGEPNNQDVEAAMHAVFLAPEESIREIVPDYWRGYFDQNEGHPLSLRESHETIYTVKAGEVSAPRVLNQQEPEFSEWARIAHYEGGMTISLVVTPSGSAQDLAIESPLGLGFDEKTIEAVSKWKFEPGMREGEPVPVRIMVQVEFHVY